MLTLTFPFIPPTANHAQKHRLMGRRIVRYNTPQYNEFKANVETELGKLNEATRAELVALMQAPHMMFMTIASPSVLKKDGTTHKNFGDSDNREKVGADAIYNALGTNDAYAYIPVPNKTVSDSTYTQISWLPFKSWKEKDFILVDHIKDAVEGL